MPALLLAAWSDDGVSGLETFVEMSGDRPAYGVKLTTLDEYIRRTLVC